MGAMDFSFRRADRGTSVFWHILGVGAGVFCLLALVLFLADAGGEEVPYDENAEILVNDGEEVVVGEGTSQAASNETDATPLTDEVTVGGPEAEGDVPAENVEVDVAPAGDAEAGAQGEGDAASIDEGIEGEGGGVSADQSNVVVDPDGTTAPTVPTPSGPEGADDSALTQD